MNAVIEAELDAALIPLRAKKLSAEAAADRLPKHLVKAFWARQVDRYFEELYAKEEDR